MQAVRFARALRIQARCFSAMPMLIQLTLASNVRAFHQAVAQEGEMQEMRNTIAEMQRQIQELREMMLSTPESGEKKPGRDNPKDAAARKAAG